jgi:hypothetical protein
MLKLGCQSSGMPFEPPKEAKPRPKLEHIVKKKNSTKIWSIIHVAPRAETPDYVRLQFPTVTNKEIVRMVYQLCSHNKKEIFTDKEEYFTGLFDIYNIVTGCKPEIRLDIINNKGSDYYILRQGDWDAMYWKPKMLIKVKTLNFDTLTHEYGHATDEHYTRTGYWLYRSTRCRMEAVAESCQHFIAESLRHEYGLKSEAEHLWSDVRLEENHLEYFKKYRNFKELFDADITPYIIARAMHHILLYKFRGNAKKTWQFLKSHNDTDVFRAIYSVLQKIYFVDALEDGRNMAEQRMRGRRHIFEIGRGK